MQDELEKSYWEGFSQGKQCVQETSYKKGLEQGQKILLHIRKHLNSLEGEEREKFIKEVKANFKDEATFIQNLRNKQTRTALSW